MRQPLPARSPRPPPTSMSKRRSSSPRTLPSSTPSGSHTDVSCGRRRSSANSRKPELGQRALQLRADLRVARPRRLEPFVEQHAEAGVQRVEHRDRRGVVVAARAARRSRRSARGRGTTTAAAAPGPSTRSTARSEKLTGARPGGTPRHFCVPEYTASMPHASTSTRDAAERGDRVDEQQRVGVAATRRAARCRCARRSTSPRARPRAARASGCAPCASSSRCGSIARPHGASTRTTSAPQRRATSHMRSPNTPFTPTITVSPGSTRLTKQVSMPAEPVPLIGSVSVFSVRNAARSRSPISSSTARKSGSRWPSTGRWNASITSGYGFDGPGPSSKRSA